MFALGHNDNPFPTFYKSSAKCYCHAYADNNLARINSTSQFQCKSIIRALFTRSVVVVIAMTKYAGMDDGRRKFETNMFIFVTQKGPIYESQFKHALKPKFVQCH